MVLIEIAAEENVTQPSKLVQQEYNLWTLRVWSNFRTLNVRILHHDSYLNISIYHQICSCFGLFFGSIFTNVVGMNSKFPSSAIVIRNLLNLFESNFRGL